MRREPYEVTITVPSDDDPELRKMLEWNKSADELWESMRKMPHTKQFELYAAARGVSVKAAIEWALTDWMMSIVVGAHCDRDVVQGGCQLGLSSYRAFGPPPECSFSCSGRRIAKITRGPYYRPHGVYKCQLRQERNWRCRSSTKSA